MKQQWMQIAQNRRIARDVYQMRLLGDVSDLVRAGQFINIKVEGAYLRRPISVCDRAEDGIIIIYKVFGAGTAKLARMGAGEKLDVLTGLGNGFDAAIYTQNPLIIGGGMGAAPMLWLAKALLQRSVMPACVLGFASAKDVYLYDELRALGVKVTVSTVDGTSGVRGFVTDAMQNQFFDYFFACGPEAMLKAVYYATDCPGQLSFEERMGCGFGACMGCSCETKYGYKRICREGPVLFKEEIIW